ncbi:MAG: biotin carboxylase N-terminal domain-containing protein [Bacteroidales bacterium]
MKTFSKVLIANRGEIAIRIIRTARKMGVRTVAIYTEQDNHALHVKLADEAYFLGSGSLAETYLNINKIVQIAIKNEIDAIHPGYGFLSENADFATQCNENNIVFIGPGVKAIQTMGNKIQAGKFVSALNIPILEMYTGSPDEIVAQVSESEFPVMVKAAAGGGGKGMRIVRDPSGLKKDIIQTAREANNYFGNNDVYVEKYIENPRHIEIQLLGDHFGNYIHLFERECSVQRRHQKIIEEAPSPSVNEKLRKKLTNAALQIAEAIDYSNAGTIEFMVDNEDNFFFLEMNTRIQVEHPVTEMITGKDIVEEQIRIAQHQVLRWNQSQIQKTGHAIEARIYAEDPENNFTPSPGKIQNLIIPQTSNIRIETGIQTGDIIPPDYDPMIAKAILWKNYRENAISVLANELRHFIISGIRHNILYIREIITSNAFLKNNISTNYIDQYNPQLVTQTKSKQSAIDRGIIIASYIFIHTINQNPENSIEQAFQHIGYWRHLMKWRIKLKEEEIDVKFTKKPGELIFQIGKKKHLANLIEKNPGYLTILIDNQRKRVYYYFRDDHWTEVTIEGFTYFLKHEDFQHIINNKQENLKSNNGHESIKSPMFGKVIEINVANNMKVKKGQKLLVLEAMKMENNIIAHSDGIIKNIAVKKGDQVKDGQILIETIIH